MSRNYRRHRDWSDAVMPAVLDVLAPLGEIREATEEEDTRHCTDLVAVDSGLRIAVRLRRPGNARYRDRITIRSRVSSGRETELQKIRSGLGPDLYFVGVTTDPATGTERPPHGHCPDGDSAIATGTVDDSGGDLGLSSWSLVSGRVLTEVLRGDVAEVENDDGTAYVEVPLAQHPGLVLTGYDDGGAAERMAERATLLRAYRRLVSRR